MRIVTVTVSVLLIVGACSKQDRSTSTSDSGSGDVRNPTLERLVGTKCQLEGIASVSPYIKENRDAVNVDGETVFQQVIGRADS